jgi:hypothetical protein
MGLFGRLLGRGGPRWQQHWAVYPGAVDDRLAMYSVDLGAVEARPVEALPVRLDVEIRFEAGEDGMPHDGALSGVQRLEDVVAAEVSQHGGAYVGRVLSGGICRYTAYLPAAPIRPLALPRDDFAPIVSTSPDPDWAHLRDVLAPDCWQRHVICDLLVVKALIGHGDGLSRRRPLEHVAYFPARGPAEAAAAELRVDGFRCTVDSQVQGRAQLEAVRNDPAAPPMVHEVTWSVREVVDRHGGEYDGWGCIATR